jgi:flagellar basal body-associated protein FliL
VRLYQDDMENILVGFTAGNGEHNEASQACSELSPNCTIIIAVFVTLAVVAMALIVLAFYRKKKRATRVSSTAVE